MPVHRRCGGPCLHANLLGEQVGGLQRQVRSRVPAVWHQCWGAVQWLHKTSAGCRWRVSVWGRGLVLTRSSKLALQLHSWKYDSKPSASLPPHLAPPPSLPSLRSVQYINRDLCEEFYGLSSYPDSLYKKVTLLKYFRSYMSEHLLKAGGSAGEYQHWKFWE